MHGNNSVTYFSHQLQSLSIRRLLGQNHTPKILWAHPQPSPLRNKIKNVDGRNNCQTSKCWLLTCVYCCVRECCGLFFFCFFFFINVAWGWVGNVVHSSHGAKPTLMPNTDPFWPGLSREGNMQHLQSASVALSPFTWKSQTYIENHF